MHGSLRAAAMGGFVAGGHGDVEAGFGGPQDRRPRCVRAPSAVNSGARPVPQACCIFDMASMLSGASVHRIDERAAAFGPGSASCGAARSRSFSASQTLGTFHERRSRSGSCAPALATRRPSWGLMRAWSVGEPRPDVRGR